MLVFALLLLGCNLILIFYPGGSDRVGNRAVARLAKNIVTPLSRGRLDGHELLLLVTQKLPRVHRYRIWLP